MTKNSLMEFWATNDGFATPDHTSMVIMPITGVRHIHMKAKHLTDDQVSNLVKATGADFTNDRWVIQMNKGNVETGDVSVYFFARLFPDVIAANRKMVDIMNDYNRPVSDGDRGTTE